MTIINVTQDPFAQGYDPVIHLHNYLSGYWKPAAGRMLITPQEIEVSQTNLADNRRFGVGAIQTKEMMAQRPSPMGKSSKPYWIVMVGLDLPFYGYVKVGVVAAARDLKAFNVEVDWLIPEGAKNEKGVNVGADLYGPFLENLVEKGYLAIGISIADSRLIEYVNRIVERGIPVATFNSEPGGLRALITNRVDQAANLVDVSQDGTKSTQFT
jgi:hypothetical protein